MPTRQQLETALRNAHNAGDIEAAKRLANALKTVEPDSFAKNTVDVAAEFSAGANRTTADLLDFLSPLLKGAPPVIAANLVKAGQAIAGGEDPAEALTSALVMPPPSLREGMKETGIEGGFMEPGLPRDIVRAGGETVPLAVGVGQALRTAAQRLPAATAGESTATGVIRDLGRSTASGDVATAALAATGAEVGEEVGGDTGAIVGAMALPVAAGAGKMLAGAVAEKAGINRGLTAASPTIGKLKGEARKLYGKIDDLGVTIKAPPLARLSESMAQTTRKEGFNHRIHPKVSAALDEVALLTTKPMTVSEINTMRKVARSAAKSIEPEEARLGVIMVDMIDNFMDQLPKNAIKGGESAKVSSLLRDARGLWGKAKKSELIEDAIERATNQASGFENGLRVQFRSLLNNKKKMRGFTNEEKNAIRKVVRGGSAENFAKALGKFGFTEGQASSMLLSSLGIAGGAAVAGPGGAVAVPLVGQTFKNIAQTLTRKNARLADELVRAGKNGKRIVEAYTRAVPKSQRSVEELTGLLLNQDATLSPLKGAGNKLIADAAYYASVINAAPLEEGEQE